MLGMVSNKRKSIKSRAAGEKWGNVIMLEEKYNIRLFFTFAHMHVRICKQARFPALSRKSR